MSYRALAVLLLLAAPAACKKANSAGGGGPGGGGFAMPAEVAAPIRDPVCDPIEASGPIGGVVGRRLVSIGTYVSSQTPLITLQSVNPQHASFDVPERYADRLRRGQLVSFQVAALPGKNFSGEVVFVDPVVALPGRTILIKARVPNNEDQLQAGMFIEARLATNIRPNAVVVPEDALLPMQGATFVWVVKDGKANQRQVTVGVRTAGWAEVQSGVEAGDQVVVGGLERLFPNAPVMARVVDRHRGAPAGPGTTAAPTRPAPRRAPPARPCPIKATRSHRS